MLTMLKRVCVVHSTPCRCHTEPASRPEPSLLLLQPRVSLLQPPWASHSMPQPRPCSLPWSCRLCAQPARPAQRRHEGGHEGQRPGVQQGYAGCTQLSPAAAVLHANVADGRASHRVITELEHAAQARLDAIRYLSAAIKQVGVCTHPRALGRSRVCFASAQPLSKWVFAPL